MSLSRKQQDDTRRELRENVERAGLAVARIAEDLGTSVPYINRLLDLEPARLEDTWILRNYLLDRVAAAGKDPVEFTALVGDWHDYWFLSGSYIDGGRITTR